MLMIEAAIQNPDSTKYSNAFCLLTEASPPYFACAEFRHVDLVSELWDSGLRVQDLGITVQGLGFRVFIS